MSSSIRRAVATVLLSTLVPPAAFAAPADRPAPPNPLRQGLRGEALSAEWSRLAGERHRLLVRDWAFDPRTDRQPDLGGRFRLAAEGAPATRYRIVQFDGAIDEARGTALSRIPGIRPFSYVPNDAFLVRVEDDAAERALSRLDGVRAILPWSAAFKLSGELVRVDVPLTDETTLNVEIFAGEDVDRIVRELRASDRELKVTHVMNRETRSRVRAVLPTANLPQALAAIGAIEGIEAVDRWELPHVLNTHSVWVTQSYDTTNGPTEAAAAQPREYPLSAKVWSRDLLGTGQIAAVADTGLDADMCFYKLSAGGAAVAQSPVPPATGTVDLTKKVHAYYVLPGATSYDDAGGHGTHVAGSVVGDNLASLSTSTTATQYSGDGMAPNARLVFQDAGAGQVLSGLTGDMTNVFTQARNAGARLHSDSWGIDQSVYSADALDMDEFMWRNEDFLFLVAMGNSGTGSADGSIGAPATAKDIVSVGATTNGSAASRANNLMNYSRGPVDDGRRKPDVTTPGSGIVSANATGTYGDDNCGTVSNSGTSMATPTTTGAMLLLRQYYADGFYPTGARTAANARTPSGALMKATMINGAMEMTGTDNATSATVSRIPSMDQGWGRTHLDRALFFSTPAVDPQRLRVWDVRNADGLITGEEQQYTISVPSGQPLRVTLVWTDPEAAAPSGVNLVNNLDLEVESPGGSSLYRGNVFAAGVSTTGGTADVLNTVEGVLVSAPGAGTWTLRVKGTSVPGTFTAPGSNRQGYALVATFGSGCTQTATVAPTGLTATDNGATGVQLSWNAAAGSTAYNVYKIKGTCAASVADMALLATTASTSYLDTKAQGGSTYAYVVRGTDGCVESPASTCASASYTGNCAIAPTFSGATDAANTTGASCQITVSWAAATSNCVSAPTVRYNVYRGTSPYFVPAAGNRIATGVTGTPYVDNSVQSSTTYYYVVRAEDSTTANSGPANGGNQDGNSNRVRATTLGTATAGNGTWTDDGGDTLASLIADYPWRVTSSDNRTPSGSYCYRSARDGWNHDPGLCASLRTPSITLTAGQTSILTFWSRYNFEYQWDGTVVEISTNGGANWSDLGDVPLSLLVPPYPTTLAQNQGNGCNFPITKGAYSGPNGNGAKTAWAQTTVSLGTFAGQTVQIRWRTASDGGLEFDGFFLDDVSITNVQRPSGCSPHFSYQSLTRTDSCVTGGLGSGNGFVDPGEDVAIAVTGVDDGNGSLTGLTATLTSSTPGVTIVDGSATLPDVVLGSTSTTAAPHFTARIPEGATCGTSADFQVSFSAAQGGPWTGTFSIPIGGTITGSPANYPSGDVPKAIADFTTATSTVSVATAGTVADVNVALNITHTYCGDLDISLLGPTGTVVDLSSDNGGAGQNFTNTTFDDEAGAPVTGGTAPFTGSFRPEGLLSGYDGTNPNGTWTLRVADDASGDSGSLTSWTLTVTTQVPSCTTCVGGDPSAPLPAPDGDFVAGTPMTALASGGNVQVTWDVSTCPSADYNLYSGAIGTWTAITGGACGIGTTGTSIQPVPADSWWIVTGTNGSEVASHGRNSAGTEHSFTGWGAGGVCPTQTTKNTSGTCP